MSRKNEQEIEALCGENEYMKKKLVGKSVTSPPNPKAVEETKDRAPTLEMDGKSCPNKSVRTIDTVDSVRRHLFTDFIVWVPLPDR